MHENLLFLKILYVININMRCIEIIKGTLGVNAVLMININMRCIEIHIQHK